MIRRVESQVAAALAFVLVVAACREDTADERSPGDRDLAVTSGDSGGEVADVPSGSDLYAVCSPCHGPQGQGTQLAPPLTGPEWIHIGGARSEIVRVIREGIATPRDYPIPMPPMGGGDFDDAELDLLAAYVDSMSRG